MFQYKHKVAIIYLAAYFLDNLNAFMASVALPTLGSTFQANAAELSWIVTAYVLGLTLIIPLSGWLGDRYGTKKNFVTSIAVFTIASYLCGFSSSIFVLIFWRFIQGLGGGMLIPVGQAMLYRQYLPLERAKISASVLIPAMLAPLLAPTIGGFIIEHLSWNYIFYLNIPFGILIFFFSIAFLKEEKQEVQTRVDLFGLFLVSLSIFLMLLSCYFLSSESGFKFGVLSFLVLAVSVILFVFYSLKKENPILELRLLKNNFFGIGTLSYFSIAISFSAINVLAIYFFQNVLGASPLDTGLLMIPFGIGTILGLKTSAFLFHKISQKVILNFSLMLFTISALLFCLIDHILQYNLACFFFLICGFSLGIFSNSVQSMSYLEMKQHKMGSASSISNLNRQLGLSLGTALATMLFSFLLESNHISGSKEMLGNPKVISIFHICFFGAASVNLIAFFTLRKLKKYDGNKEEVIEGRANKQNYECSN